MVYLICPQNRIKFGTFNVITFLVSKSETERKITININQLFIILNQ